MKLEDLKLYQECLDFESKIWNIVNQWEGFNKETVGKPFVTSADSISANIATGYRRYNFKDKKHYCYISRGFLLQTKGWVLKSAERTLISAEESTELLEFIEKIHRMLNAYIRSIGRSKSDNNYNKSSNHNETDGNAIVTENKEATEEEPNGNSFTASADEFFSEDELTTNA